ncbi:Beta-tubulin 2 tubb2 [Oopsacas minuta]|uniref:Beta-tubulin 2 tubb2 n=1 Tax=Oopsacas minuta TaxID=111878 RepID=A0AAV7JRX6_9METZ|nr:Beta-tubulin 2 tubb2 [Oopsacas minuta]
MEASGIVFIHGGGAGSMIGESMWKQLIREHGISVEGIKDDSIMFDCPGVAFQEIDKGLYRPRSLFIDPDAQDVTRIRKGMLKKLWSPDTNFVTSNKDTGNLYTEGYYTTYYSVNEGITEKIRRLVEPIDQLEGFLISRSVSGGTGSGLMKRVMTDLMRDFTKRPIAEVCLFPSTRYSDMPIEPYNAMFGIDTTDNSNCYSMLLSNEGVGEYIANAFSKPYCTMSEINSVIARLMCNVTCQARMSGERVLEKLIKTAAYSCRAFNIAMPSYSVLCHEDNNKLIECKLDLTRQIFQDYTQLLGYPLSKSVGNYLNYQGNTSELEAHGILTSSGSFDISKLSTNTSINAIEKWVPTRVFEDSSAPYCELAHVSVNVGVCQALKDLAKKYDKLMSTRAYIHWIVGCGISSECVGVEREEVQSFIQDISEVLE